MSIQFLTLHMGISPLRTLFRDSQGTTQFGPIHLASINQTMAPVLSSNVNSLRSSHDDGSAGNVFSGSIGEDCIYHKKEVLERSADTLKIWWFPSNVTGRSEAHLSRTLLPIAVSFAMLQKLVSFLAVVGVASASPAGQGSINPRASSFWYANMDHTGAARGYAPHVDNPGSYPVFKTVNPGDGGAIQSAIDTAGNGNRQNQWLASQPRVRPRPDAVISEL